MAFESPHTLHPEFTDALKAGDVERLIGLYEPGAVSVQPDGSRAAGSLALRATLSGLAASGTAVQGRGRRVIVNDDLALTSSAWSSRITRPDGSTATVEGITAEVSRRQPDGTWKVVIDVPAFGGNHGAGW